MVKKKLPKKVIREVEDFMNILKSEKIPIKKVLVFGSYAKGKQGKWSDIDVCIVSPKFKDAWKSTQYLWEKLPDEPNSKIEPVGFSPKDFKEDPSPLIHEIKKH